MLFSQLKIIPQLGIYLLPQLNDFKSAGTFLQANYVIGRTDKSNNFGGWLPFDRNIEFPRAQEEESWYSTVKQEENLLFIYHIRMVYKNEIIGILQVATEISDEENAMQNMRNMLILLSFLTIIIAATLGWYLARKALRPIEQVIAAANRIENGSDLGQRINHEGPHDEIGRLTSTINGMLARLQSTYQELEESAR